MRRTRSGSAALDVWVPTSCAVIRLVVVGDDGAGQTTGVLSGAAGHDVRAGQRVEAILLVGGPFVDVDVVGFAATRHGHVEHRAGGGFGEDGVGGVGGDALGGVHGDGVAVGDVLANVVAGEGG